VLFIGAIMAQHFSLNAGLKKFGVPGEKATTKELTQLHDMVTFIPRDPAKLNRADMLKALSSLMFLIEKRDGTSKVRACVDGSKQRRDESYNKNDYALPTCTNESIMITSAIEAKEGRDVAIIDIPDAYLHNYIDKHGNEKSSCYSRESWPS